MKTPSPRRFSTTALAAMLSRSVGDDVALFSVTDAAIRLRLPPGEISETDALALFAEIAEGDGIIAISARFVRSRLIAQFAREDLECHGR